MSVGEERSAGERFQVWVRRSGDSVGPYALRFEVGDGKGILRVARPGVLIDPPARPTGHEEHLTAAQVRATRFLHVWDGGRSRQSHHLARLEEALLEVLPLESWVLLRAEQDGNAAVLVLPADAPPPPRTDDEPTWPRRQMLAELRRELQAMGGARPWDAEKGRPIEEADEGRTEIQPAPESAEPRPVRAERFTLPPRSVRTIPPMVPIPSAGGAPAKREDAIGSLLSALDAWIETQPAAAEDEEDRTVLMGGSALSRDNGEATSPALPTLPPLDTPPRRVVPDEFEYARNEPSFDGVLEAGEAPESDEDVSDPNTTPETLEAAPSDEEASGERTDFHVALAGPPTEAVTVVPAAPEPAPTGGLEAHERVTTLVRFLRRQIAKDRLRISALEAQVRTLEAELRAERLAAGSRRTR